jgi:hypothetical protein
VLKSERLKMSLDVTLMITQPTEVYTSNITHNLGVMARAVKLSDGNTLYNILWRPDECIPPYEVASEISELLDEGLNILLASPEEYKQYNPENGWGSYDGLVSFVYRYRNATWEYPESTLQISR